MFIMLDLDFLPSLSVLSLPDRLVIPFAMETSLSADKALRLGARSRVNHTTNTNLASLHMTVYKTISTIRRRLSRVVKMDVDSYFN